MKRLILIFLASLLLFPTLVSAEQAEYSLYQAQVKQVNSDSIEVKFSNHDLPQSLELPTVNLKEEIRQNLIPGDRILVENYKTSPDDPDNFNAIDYVRNTQIYLLLGIFAFLTLIVAKKKGLASLFTLGLSFIIIFFFTIKQIIAGADPVTISLITTIILIPLNFYIIHGFKRKTSAAIIGTIVAMVITIVLANIFVNWSRLTGMSSDEAFWLIQNFQQVSNLRGLLIGAIMLGIIGVMDDITITQTSIVQELLNSSKQNDPRTVYKKAMTIGQDHISSMVNTLILVYASASLPLFVLLSNDIGQIGNLISMEIIAEEIIRMLIASIGLIIAVPITTKLATQILKPEKN